LQIYLQYWIDFTYWNMTAYIFMNACLFCCLSRYRSIKLWQMTFIF